MLRKPVIGADWRYRWRSGWAGRCGPNPAPGRRRCDTSRPTMLCGRRAARRRHTDPPPARPSPPWPAASQCRKVASGRRTLAHTGDSPTCFRCPALPHRQSIASDSGPSSAAGPGGAPRSRPSTCVHETRAGSTIVRSTMAYLPCKRMGGTTLLAGRGLIPAHVARARRPGLEARA